LSSHGLFLYPRIKCPFCKYFTTNPESLGIHLVDKHGSKVISGTVKIKAPKAGKRKKGN
jgi:hypothetical protein